MIIIGCVTHVLLLLYYVSADMSHMQEKYIYSSRTWFELPSHLQLNEESVSDEAP